MSTATPITPMVPETTFMVISDDRGPLVTIHADGKITYGEHYQPDQTAKTFWKAMVKHRPSAIELQQKLIKHYQDAVEKIARLPDDRRLFGSYVPLGEEAVEVAARALRTAPRM